MAIHDLRTGEAVSVVACREDGDPVVSVQWAADGASLIAAKASGQLLVLSPHGRVLRTLLTGDAVR